MLEKAEKAPKQKRNKQANKQKQKQIKQKKKLQAVRLTIFHVVLYIV